MRFIALLIIAISAASVLAGPTGPRSSCALHCNQDHHFAYETGKSYVYEYSVTTSTTLLGTFEDDAHMHITANAHIDVTAPCEYVLKLTEVNLEGSSHASDFAEAITKLPLRFSFQDGHVENVCNEVSEPTWVLNFKRGVLSTFQSTVTQTGIKDMRETDISGSCKTHYNTTTEGTTTIINKVKDLASCIERPDPTVFITSTHYNTDSPVQSLPLFSSTSECHQRVEEGLLKLAECEETHTFRPFSSENGGAVTTAKTTMFLANQDRPSAIANDNEFMHSTLVFEPTTTASTGNHEAVEQLLNNLNVASHSEILPEVPVLFSKLVASLKTLNYPQLSSVYNNAEETHSKKFLVDAMPLVGTAAAAGVVRDMYLNGDISQEEADIWFTSLAFLKNPTSDMFTALAPLLENNPSQKAMLGTSALVNTYCKIHHDCESDSGIQQIIRNIEMRLGSSCRSLYEREKIGILVTLKALGNAGRWINANSILRRCYTEENDMEVRVAAIEAYRHTPCEYDRSNLLAAFQDETQDTEIRIAAYLALFTCPTPELINTIKDRLTSEGVNQVGSFIWTHMTNIQESAAPGKQWIREMIGEDLLQKKFSTEALKFSRNYESSFFTNALNAGAAFESNIIFSSKSFLPRSAMLNLTLDLFGQSVNFFEVGGRIEGFEAYIERFFGPNGYYPEETIEGILRNMREQKPDAEPNTLERFLDETTDEPEGSYYLRVFGNELHYNHFRGIENIMRESGASSPLEFLMDLARKGDVDYTKSYNFLDAKHTIPTVSGLPLTVTAEGTATLGLRMNGNFKAHSLKNINIEGHIHPSAVVNIDGIMVVDAHVTRTGMKVSSNLRTSTYLDGKLKINGGKLVDIAFNTPKDKMEVISFNREFFYLEDDQEIRKEVEDQTEYEGCTNGITGMALCGDLSYTPKSRSISSLALSGPMAAHVYFKRTDTQTGYILKFSHTRNELSFLMDTPGSQNDHKISLHITKADQTISADLHTPYKSIQGKGEHKWQKNKKHMKLKLTVDGTESYSVDTGYKVSGGNTRKLEPYMSLTSPRGEMINGRGKLQANPTACKYDVDITLSGLDFSTVVFKASYDGAGGESGYGVTAALTSPTLEASLNGQLNYDGTSSVSTKADIEYSFGEDNKQRIHHNALIQKESSNALTTYSAKFVLTPTQFADMALDMDYKTTVSQGHIETTCVLVHGPATWTAEQEWAYNVEGTNQDFNFRLALKCPYYNFDYLFSDHTAFSENHFENEEHIRIGPGNELSRIITVNLEEEKVTAKATAEFGDFKNSMDATLRKIALGHYTAKMIIEVMDEKHEFESNLRDNTVQGKINTILDGSLTSSSSKILNFNIGIYGDNKKASVDFKSNLNGQDYTLKAEGTRSSILIDVNIIRHILLNAYVTTADETQKLLVNAEWDKDVDPTKVMLISGELSPKAIQANLKYGTEEASLTGKILEEGVEMEAKWAPNKRVAANAQYSLGDTKSLTITVETPFQGWEKQNAAFNFSLKEYELDSRFVATWKNAEQLTLTVTGKLQPGLFTNQLSSKILFSSSFNDFERITFSLDHKMQDTTINTNIEGIWNNQEMKAAFELLPNENGINGRAIFSSPFTEDLLVILNHHLLEKDLSTIVEATYGEETSTFTLKGHLDLKTNHDVTLILKVETPMTAVPNINANLKYQLTENNLELVLEGNADGKKMMLNISGEKTFTGDSTVITGEMRFITPLTNPLTASLNHNHDSQNFMTQFEMSRIWSTYGSLKLHAEGHFVSKDDITLTADMASPANKGSFSFTHKIANHKMTSSVDSSLNGKRISASLNGILDTTNTLANLDFDVVSTFTELDDIKVRFETLKDENSQISKVILTKGTQSLNIDHTFSFKDKFNWEHSLIVNDQYMLHNKQTSTESTGSYSHELEYKWDNQVIHIIGSFSQRVNSHGFEIDASLSVVTPWTEDLKADYSITDDGQGEITLTLSFEYQPGRKIETVIIHKETGNSTSLESSLITPFWQPLGFKLTTNVLSAMDINLILTHGDNKTTIDLNGSWEEGKAEGHIEVQSTYLPLPVSVEASYDISSQEKKAYLLLNTDKRYELRGSFSGHAMEAKWHLASELPLEMVRNIELSGEYHVTGMPITANVHFKLNSQEYEVTTNINTNEFKISMDANGKKGGITSEWSYNHTTADFKINFQSPFTSIADMRTHFMYNFETEKKFSLISARGDDTVRLLGKFEDETLIFEGTTPFSGLENINASFFMSSSAITATAAINDYKYEVTGTMHIRRFKGKINLDITTPFEGYDTISAETSYSLQGPTKTVEFKSTFGGKELSLNGVVDVTDLLAPGITLSMTTPSDVFMSLGGEAHWDFRNTAKTVEVKAYQNDHQYHWQLEVAADSPLKGHVISKITTPLTGWSDVQVEGSFDFTSMPYKIIFTYNKEGVTKTYEGHLSITPNTVSGELATPIIGLERVVLNGDYRIENQQLTGNAELTMDSDTYQVDGNLLFNTQTPYLSIHIKTPVSEIADIELNLESNLIDTRKTLRLKLKCNDISYSVDFTGEWNLKATFVKVLIQSPIPGYSNLDIQATYDFTADIKTAEMTLKVEGESKHFSVTGQVNNNNIIIDVHTPFEDFEALQLNGDYLAESGEHQVLATFEKNGQSYSFSAHVSQNTKSASMEMNTPIDVMKTVKINGKYDVFVHGIEALLTFERNNDKFHFNTRGIFTPIKSDLHVTLETPVEGWKTLSLKADYDLLSDKKRAEVSVEKETITKTIAFEVSCTVKSGSFRVVTPVEGFEVLGAEYILNIDESNKRLDASVKIHQNSHEWVFAASGQYTPESIAISFQTPFEGFNTISVEGNIDWNMHNGQGLIKFGPYNLTTNVSFNIDNVLFQLTTPFPVLKVISLSATHKWTANQKDATLKVTYNDNVYAATGSLDVSALKSGFNFKLNTPFQNFSTVFLEVKYDIENTDELLSAHLTLDQNEYKVLMGGYIQEKVALFKCDLTLPVNGWTNAHFIAKVDLTQDDKIIQVSLERDGNIKEITINGKLIGSTLDFNLRTPFSGIEFFTVSSSVNRAKRSVEFRMMNDAGEATLLTSFNSIKLHLKTPFENAEEIKWEITKTGDHSYYNEWRKNDNYLTISVEQQGKKTAFNVEVNSELQGWEFLALSGNLDEETLQGYLSGAVNEDKITVSGSGTFDVKSTYTLTIDTPYSDYRHIDVTFNANRRKKSLILEAASTSSDFHFILKLNKSSMHSHLFVPNPQEPTELTVDLKPFTGKINFSSRFESLRKYYQEYDVQFDRTTIHINQQIKVNDLEVFSMKLDAEEPRSHLEIHTRRPGVHTQIILHREGMTSMNFLFKRELTENGVATEKEFKIDVAGSGNLATKGEIDIVIINSFSSTPTTITAKLELDRTEGQRKHFKLEVTPRRNKLYIFNLDYDVSEDRKTGDFNLRITTPERSNAPWKSISGNWNVDNTEDVTFTIKFGNISYTARGKVSLMETNLILTPENSNSENLYLQWRFKTGATSLDYYLKVGRESNYVLLKLKGTIIDYAHVDVEGGFKFGTFQDHEFLFTTKWNQRSDGVVTGEGTFNYGEYHGSHKLERFHHDLEHKRGNMAWSATSNIPEHRSVILSGNYDFDRKVVINAEVKANEQDSKLDISFTDLNPQYSRNTAEFYMPILGPQYGAIQLTLSHDFREETSKSLSAVAKMGEREEYVKVNWNRSQQFDTLDGNIHIKAKFIGEVHITAYYDVSNLENAHAEVTYTRTSRHITNNLNIKWFMKNESGHAESELLITSPFEEFSHARIHAEVNYSTTFHLASALEWNDKKITVKFDIGKKAVTGEITTPFEDYELIKAKLSYNLKKKSKKTVSLSYERGADKLDFKFVLNIKPQKEGDLELTLTTPYEFAQNLRIEAKWKNKQAEVNYHRNDITYNFSGEADIKADKSSFDISFASPGRENIRIAAFYDIKSFLEGTGTEDQKLASLDLEFGGNNVHINLHGFHNSQQLYLEAESNSSFDHFQNFHLKSDSKITAQSTESEFELAFNDFDFKVHNLFERRENNGYYFKSKIESSLIPLPALIIGFGYENEERILTIGYGEEKEITFSIKGKNNFRSGFSGFVDIPHFGYEGVTYDASYGFGNANEMHVNVDIELGEEEQKVEVDFVYESEGVRAQLTSPTTGEHSFRVRRSITSESFYAEAGLDDFNLQLRGGFKNEDTKRGLFLEGDIFGKKFMIDCLFQSEGLKYTEGKLILHSPFQGMEKLGGLFTWAFINNKVVGHAEILLPSYTVPSITGEINIELNENFKGFASLDVGGEEFRLESNIVRSSSPTKGYKGTIELVTPFHVLSHVLVQAEIKEASSTEIIMKIDTPFATHELRLTKQLTNEELTATAFIQSTKLYKALNIAFNLKGFDPMNTKAELSVNENKFAIEYFIEESAFKFNLDSLLLSDHRQLSVEAKYPSKDDIEGTLLVTLGEETHRAHGSFALVSDHISGELDVTSSLIEGERKLKFDVNIPGFTFKKVVVDASLGLSDNHSVKLDFDVQLGIHVKVIIDSPIFPKMTGTFELAGATAGLVIETPNGVHKLMTSWRVTRKMPADYIGNLELSSPLLAQDYNINVMFGGNQGRRQIKVELLAGGIKHLIEGNAFIREKAVGFSLNLETPFKNIIKATLESSLSFEQKVEMHITAAFSENSNTFDMVLDKDNRSFMAEAKSPFIPTGLARVEASLTGDMNKNMKIMMALKNTENTISGNLAIRIKSSDNIATNLKVITPFKGYKKMTFGAQYIKDEVTNLLLFVDKPIKFNVDLHFGNKDDEIKAHLKVETDIDDFELIEGELHIPLHRFSPKAVLTLPHHKYGLAADLEHGSFSRKVSGELYFNDRSLGGHLGMRTKAPYELDYSSHYKGCKDSFHLRTDSSFFSVFT